MVTPELFTEPSPADQALLRLHAGGVSLLMEAARSRHVVGGLVSLRLLLAEVLQLSMFGLDIENIQIAPFEYPFMTCFEFFIRVPSFQLPGSTPFSLDLEAVHSYL